MDTPLREETEVDRQRQAEAERLMREEVERARAAKDRR